MWPWHGKNRTVKQNGTFEEWHGGAVMIKIKE